MVSKYSHELLKSAFECPKIPEIWDVTPPPLRASLFPAHGLGFHRYDRNSGAVSDFVDVAAAGVQKEPDYGDSGVLVR